ncbi:ABC transporter substrate-binding protein [Grimontia kaedaensis]|uniref:ABC transporter substrate-binding protein n=1 Tax=Grimontia kaedaensis TaxID=2872157 RepID=A0ABY4WY01_9GAMM|nr:extracellular solute-binding protein [Grimontia kaedaensis]USH03862.1 ABC transporter substrate-binding protein [Grimontia kaedaensis]
MPHILRLFVLLWLVPGFVVAKPQDTIVVLTSFPESFYTPIKTAFEKAHPSLNLQVLNKKTPAVIQHIANERSPKSDLVWMSSADAMATLQSKSLIDEPVTFAWSQFVFFWHNDKLSELGISSPKRWEDLLSPSFHQQIAISAPSRSGTNHLLIEIILQQYGWEDGWAYLSQLGGNLATVTARSFGVREGVIKQRFTLGPVVDFFYRSALAEGHPVGFEPVPNTPLIAAKIAHIRSQSKNTSSEKFVKFLLSDSGQNLLSLPNVNRISLQQGERITEQNPSPVFDPYLSAMRYHAVNALFDQLITNRLADLQTFWQQWHQIQSDNIDIETQDKLNAIFEQATAVPISHEEAADQHLNNMLSPERRYTDTFQSVTGDWRKTLSQNLDAATAALETIKLERNQ